MDRSLPLASGNALQAAQATLEAMLFTQMLRPLTEKAGPAAGYAAETFAETLVRELGRAHE